MYWAMLLTFSGLAAPGEPWVVLDAVEAAGERWGALVPAPGPARDGEPTIALRWQPQATPGPNSPAVLQGWDTIEAVRFWMHTDQAWPFNLVVVLTGSGTDGYFSASFPVDFAGWQQVVLPLAAFQKVRVAELATSTTLGFRAQGYGQPELNPESVWWIDQLEVLPKPGTTPRVTNSLTINRERWAALAASGNPLVQLAAQAFAAPVTAYEPPAELKSAWTYRGEAEKLLALAWAAADPDSPHRGRADLLDRALGLANWLVGQCQPEGWWWRQGPIAGDPNVNRFTLGPLLDAIYRLRTLPEGEAAWPRWAARLDAAIDLQRRAYEDQSVAWDWGGLAASKYVNQDVYYLLIMELSSRLFDRPADQALAAAMMVKTAANQLPDGGWHYIGVEQEAPVYHSLDLIILARYAELTQDPVVVESLQRSAPYFPLTLTAEAYPEYWSDVWWKQTWGDQWVEALVVAAGTTREPANQALMMARLARSIPRFNGLGSIYAMSSWPGLEEGQPPAETYVVADANIRGVRGRQGPWSYGVTRGRGLRNTFVGGVITTPERTAPLLAAFRGANLGVQQTAAFRQRLTGGLLLSQIDDRTALATSPDGPFGIGVRYRPQPPRVNGWPTPETPDTPWQVDQVWLATGEGFVGQVTLTALEAAPGEAIVGRLRLGPGPVVADGDVWRCGPLQVRLYESFGEVSPAPMPHYVTPLDQTWPGLELREALPADGAIAGQTWRYTVFVGPAESELPERVEPLADHAGFVVHWPGRPPLAMAANPGPTPLTLALPDLGLATAWTGEAAEPVALTRTPQGPSLTLPPGQAAIVSRPAG